VLRFGLTMKSRGVSNARQNFDAIYIDRRVVSKYREIHAARELRRGRTMSISCLLKLTCWSARTYVLQVLISIGRVVHFVMFHALHPELHLMMREVSIGIDDKEPSKFFLNAEVAFPEVPMN